MGSDISSMYFTETLRLLSNQWQSPVSKSKLRALNAANMFLLSYIVCEIMQNLKLWNRHNYIETKLLHVRHGYLDQLQYP